MQTACHGIRAGGRRSGIDGGGLLISDRQEPVATRTFKLQSHPSIRVGRGLLVVRHPCHRREAHRDGDGMLAIPAGKRAQQER